MDYNLSLTNKPSVAEKEAYLFELANLCLNFTKSRSVLNDFTDISEFLNNIFQITKLDSSPAKMNVISSHILPLYDDLDLDGKRNLISTLITNIGMSRFVHLITHAQLLTYLEDGISLDWRNFNPGNFHLNIVSSATSLDKYNTTMCVYEICFVRMVYSFTPVDLATLAYNMQSLLTSKVLDDISDVLIKRKAMSMLLSLKLSFDELYDTAPSIYAKNRFLSSKDPVTRNAFFSFDGINFNWSQTALKCLERLDSIKIQLIGSSGLSLFDELSKGLQYGDLFTRYMDISQAVNSDIHICDKGFEYDIV